MEETAGTEARLYVPRGWSVPPAADEAVALAARACRETAALAAERPRSGFVVAFCQLAEERLCAGDDDAAVVLCFTVKTLDAAAERIGADDVEAALFGSSCRRCAEACRTALVGLLLEPR